MNRASIAPTESALRGRGRLGPADAAIYETFVVPRYMSLFAELAIEGLVEGEDPQVVHMFCRTGYPDRGVMVRLPDAHIFGCDPSPHALELARAKSKTMPGMVSHYQVMDGIPTALPPAAFSHGIAIHPLLTASERVGVLEEFARLLAPHAQLVYAMPIRGSYQELLDLLREFALKYDMDSVNQAVEQATALRPSVELLGAEVEEAGFNYVDVDVRTQLIKFQSGRDFFEDPVTRLMILPDLQLTLRLPNPEIALVYLREAIDKYWSDSSFELTVQIGCASGRRVP